MYYVEQCINVGLEFCATFFKELIRTGQERMAREVAQELIAKEAMDRENKIKWKPDDGEAPSMGVGIKPEGPRIGPASEAAKIEREIYKIEVPSFEIKLPKIEDRFAITNDRFTIKYDEGKGITI
jgi:hypothetical protein